MKARFADEGLDYDPPPDVVPNTRLALRLTELARDCDLHRPMHDRLMDAYWAEARDIGDPSVLRELAAEVGIHDVDAVLDGGDSYVERITASTGQAQALGITGIPAFLLDGRLLVLGAQPDEVFDQAFAQLAEA